MGKTSVRKRIKQFWQALTIKKKIATFTGTVFLIIAVSVLFNVWVVKFSLIDFNRILQDNAAVSELAQALEEESIQFETYIKGNREERESLDIAIERTGRAVEKLPFRYSEIGEQRYAKTWSIKSCYEVYCQKRDAMLAMGENAPDYIKRLYEVYEMQDYLEEYAATLMNETIEDGDGLYHKKVPMLICMPIVVVVSGIILVSGMMELAALMNQTIITPVVAHVKAAQLISANDFFSEDVQVQNEDELGELVDNINDMSLKISQSEKIQTEFISSVSHELRTPLTAINGWSETLLEDDDPAQLRRGLHIILKESRRLTNMVEELLEFSKMQDGRFTLRIEDVDLQTEFEDAVYTYQEVFRQDGIRLEYDDDGELYADPIPGDPERLKQVLCNVLDNAAKHGGSGKRIIASLRREADNYVIRIRDFGPGIPPAELPYVKQKFYKGSSKARGSGIGLAVCDEIITRHGGTFEIGNADGGGALVTITLPIPPHTEHR